MISSNIFTAKDFTKMVEIRSDGRPYPSCAFPPQGPGIYIKNLLKKKAAFHPLDDICFFEYIVWKLFGRALCRYTNIVVRRVKKLLKNSSANRSRKPPAHIAGNRPNALYLSSPAPPRVVAAVPARPAPALVERFDLKRVAFQKNEKESADGRLLFLFKTKQVVCQIPPPHSSELRTVPLTIFIHYGQIVLKCSLWSHHA